ncbi:cytochrome c oxidase assembly factor CtaG [Heyndrickxia oleronia]|uniref:cytochrome c oxidase assembly factor CtaG n=1 Tax=Heyndrickxia oleronia TaxID=38875 RepID=UPI00203CE20B|nr:cytochrome c oxidase assembly factor CtaG [Heyndrickxia oleronia]MCM3237855.1 cytochrome c oxidase assembly factor CtaG [Heyndrickxia oleronia]
MPISIFGFQALWSPFFMITILFMTVLYFLITIKWRKDFKNSEPLTKKQAIYFIISMILLYLVKGSPVDLLAHIMFTYHMVQMSILLIIMTPLLMLSIPNWLWEAFLKLPVIKPIFRFFTKPILAVVLFNVLFSFYHIPFIFDTIKMSETLHGGYTMLLFIFALFMWWPLLNSLPDQTQLSGIKRVGYLFASAILLTPACGILIFAGKPLYETYSNGAVWLQAMTLCVPTDTLAGLNLSGPELFSTLPVTEDQQLGAIIMKLVQEVIYGFVLARIFYQWFKKDQIEAEEFTQRAMMEQHPQPTE